MHIETNNALGSQFNFDESYFRVKVDHYIREFEKVDVVKDDNHGLDVYAFVHGVEDETEDGEYPFHFT